MKSPWKVIPPTRYGKKVFVYGPGDVYMEVDFDICDQRQVLVDVTRAVEILNREWAK